MSQSGSTPDSPATAVELYQAAEDYVHGLITGPPSPAPDTPPEVIRQRALDRLDRLRAFLAFLGNPHEQYRTIHIGGTSGKGSTTALTASILTEAGYRTGNHVSPYLQVATEKLQVDGEIASAARYHELVETMRKRVEQWVALGNPQPTYGEFWIAMTFRYFAEEQVDYAVIEVGAGGRFDLTNVIQPDVAAITSVGYDHTVSLGSTLPEIAWHKAGILKSGAAGITAVNEPESLSVIEDEARSLNVNLVRIAEGESFSDVQTDYAGTSFLDRKSGRTFHTGLVGTFQGANGATAAAVARALPNGPIDDDTIAAGLAKAGFPGRMEVVQQSPLVMLDGAHNPQKIAGLSTNIDLLFPERRIILVFGVLESKRFEEMMQILAPRVSALVTTDPQVYAKPPVSAAEIAERASGIATVKTEPDPLDALQKALDLAGQDDVVLVTGSLYLVGNVREHWYPTEQILIQGTVWPAS